MLMDYMREIKEISAEQAIILWQASRLSLSKIYEKAPEILKVQGSVIGTLCKLVSALPITANSAS